MLDKIYDFALKNNKNILSSDFKQKKIGAYIMVDTDGNYQLVDIVEQPEGSYFPAIGNTGASMTNIIIEKTDIVLCNNTTAVRENYYINKVKECVEHSPTLQPVLTFLNNVRNNASLKNSVLNDLKNGSVKLKSDLISFKINGDKIEQNKDVVDAMLKVIPHSNTSLKGISSITNKEKPLCQEPVKFKFKVAGYDTPIAPFSKSKSTESYFQSGAIISRIGQDEIDIIKSGFETLLNDGKHYNEFFKLIHWYDDELNEKIKEEPFFDFLSFSKNSSVSENINNTETDVQNNALKYDKQASEILNSVQNINEKTVGNIKDNFYHVIFCYAPCDSRYRLYGYREWNIHDAKKNLDIFKKDSTIDIMGEQSTIDNLRSFLFSFVPANIKMHDREQFIKKTYGSNVDRLIYSVYDNTQIPIIFFRKAIDIASHYISIDKNKNTKDDKYYFSSNYYNAIKTIKLYQNRKENYMQNKNAYLCGRAFAVYEKLQNHATNGMSVSGMFDVAKKYPLRVFNQLSSLSKHHINKLGNTGSAIYYKKLLDSFLGEMDTIPTKFSLEEQGDFILGYHYQNTKFYTKTDKGDIENE